MNKPLAFDMDGYELFEGDYVACAKRLYRINKILKTKAVRTGIMTHPATALELIHVKTTKIVKRKDFEVERLN